jgi:predicted  nucleic acid-binding Zn-ribbon protein
MNLCKGGAALDGMVERDGGEPYDRGLEVRVTRVEHEVGDIKGTLTDIRVMFARIEAVIPNLMTKSDLTTEIARVDTRILELRSDMDLQIRDLRSGMDGKMADLRSAMGGLRSDMDGLRSDMGGKMTDLRSEMTDLRSDVRTRLDILQARLDATLPHLATRADLAAVPTKTYMWGIMAALLTAYACGLAALAVLK